MSLSAISRCASSCPSGCAISSVTERLLRFTPTKYALSLVFGMYGGAKPRVPPPAPGGSILITSAPRSPSICTQVGPASTRVRSNTRKPARGPVDSVIQLTPLARGNGPGPYSPPLICRPPATAKPAAANLRRNPPAMPESRTPLRHGESIEGPRSWIAACLTLAILSVGYGAPLLVVVGLKPIQTTLASDRSVIALA